MENIMDDVKVQDKIVRFYESNKNVQEFILNFFKLKRKNKKGESEIRSRVIHNIRRNTNPLLYCNRGLICLSDINENNFWPQMNIKGTMHFREWAYSEDTRRSDSGKIEGYEFEECRMGIGIVLDIDAPSIVVNGEEVKVDFFDTNYFPDFQKAKMIVEREIQEMGKDYNCLFSGNGIYIILESYYPNLEGMSSSEINYFWDVKYATDVRVLVDDINLILEENNVLSRIDPRWKSWSIYHKIPFTYHGKVDRLSIPICKGEMNYDFINTMTRLDRLDILDTGNIIKNAMWRDIW